MAELGKFKIGDRVKVTTTRFGNHQYGQIGEVYMLVERPNLPIRVRFANGGYNAYSDPDLTLLEECQLMPEPEFTLDEMAQAEELVGRRG